jgi:hypothetical protein
MGSYFVLSVHIQILLQFCFFLDFFGHRRWYCEFFNLLISCGCCNPKENFFGVCDETFLGFSFFKKIFFWGFLSGWIGNHPWEDLAKFGYSSERTSVLFWISSFLWWHRGTCCLNMAISVSFSSKYVNYGSVFLK